MNAVIKFPVEHPPLSIVRTDELAEVWPKIAHHIEAAIEHGQGDEQALDVLLACARGRYFLATDGANLACVFEYVKHPKQTVVTLLYAGGALDACFRAFQWAKEYCKANGVDVLRVWGRPGWQRVLGLEPIGAIMQVRLS